MRFPIRAAVAAIAATVALAGCGLFGDGADEAGTTTATTVATTTTTTIPAPAEPTVLEAGSEPRRPLRITLTEGDVTTISFTADLAIDQEANGRRQRLDSPPITQVIRYRVNAVDDEGADISFEVDAAIVATEGTGLAPDETAAMQASIDPLVGLSGGARISPTGQLSDVELSIPAGAGEALVAQADQLTAQIAGLGPTLPTEAVGVGARWEALATSTAGGATVESTTTFTLVALTDDEATYAATVEMSAEPQDLALDGLAEGTTARLESSDLTGTTEGALSLTSLVASLQTRITGPQVVTLQGPDGERTLTQDLLLAYSARP